MFGVVAGDVTRRACVIDPRFTVDLSFSVSRQDEDCSEGMEI